MNGYNIHGRMIRMKLIYIIPLLLIFTACVPIEPAPQNQTDCTKVIITPCNPVKGDIIHKEIKNFPCPIKDIKLKIGSNISCGEHNYNYNTYCFNNSLIIDFNSQNIKFENIDLDTQAWYAL